MNDISIKLDLGIGAMLTAGLAILMPDSLASATGPLVLAIALYTLLTTLILTFHSRAQPLGWPNRITLLRAIITIGLASALAQPTLFIDRAFLVIALVVTALVLDGLDGWLARRLGEASDFGARFDMETDTALIVVLCCALWLSGQAPAWVLLIGLIRPAFIVAGLVVPWLARQLPENYRRKLVCVIQTAVLPVALLPDLPGALRMTLLAGALLTLVYSFAVDIAWLYRNRRASIRTQWRMP